MINLRRFALSLGAALLFALLLASPGAAAQITLDPDNDGLMDEVELEIGTDPNDADSDNDRLSDGFEVREFGTDPLAWDSDGDGFGDGDELEVYGTDALDPNSYPRDDEPAPGAPPVERLPSTGAGTLAARQGGSDALMLLVAAGSLLLLATTAALARRRA